nr:MAG TPA: hypothetical protein [Caudoviricetes sp.]
MGNKKEPTLYIWQAQKKISKIFEKPLDTPPNVWYNTYNERETPYNKSKKARGA